MREAARRSRLVHLLSETSRELRQTRDRSSRQIRLGSPCAGGPVSQRLGTVTRKTLQPGSRSTGRKDQPMWKTGLDPWQLDLIARLERGLGRPLLPADLACVAWEPGGKVMSVVE